MKSPVLQTYFRETVKHPWLLAALVIGTLGKQAADLTVPILLRQFFNLLAAHAAGPAGYAELLHLLILLALTYFGSWAALRIYGFSNAHLESRVVEKLHINAFDYLIRHSYHFFVSQFTGTLTRRVSKFANAYETIVDITFGNFIPTALFAVGVTVVLFVRNHTLGIVLAACLIFLVAFQLFFNKLRQPLRIARSQEDSRMVGALADAISNQNTITLFSGVPHEHGRFSGAVARWRAATIRSWNSGETMWAIQGFFMFAVNVGILYGAVQFWQRGLLAVGDFILIQIYLIGTFDRLVGISRELRRFYDAYADASEMVEILETPHEVRDAPDAEPLEIRNGAIEFKSVNFYFHDAQDVLNDFNLSVRAGEKLALVGPSGAGKSTITKLLLRLYDVNGGSVEIDGQNIARVTQESLRNAVAFVPQEPILFHRTLMENIRYGRRDASEAEVIEAAKKAHCHEFISALQLGYETYVGERGIKLSGGERQRIAIARAILKTAPILVLDEATSSLDSESEAMIQDALQTLMKNKTAIVIAHRLSTIMKMDRIVVLENGAIVAEGTHTALLAQDGLYQKLWSIQAGGFGSGDNEPEVITEETIEPEPDEKQESL